MSVKSFFGDLLTGGLPEALDFPNASTAPQATQVQFTERTPPSPEPEDRVGKTKTGFEALLTSPVFLGLTVVVFGGLVVWGLRR